MVNRFYLAFILAIGIGLGGCASKLGVFVSASVEPLEPNPVQLSDGYEAVYYKIQKGALEETDTLMFFIGGPGHASLNYYLENYFEDLPGDVTIYALQKRHVRHMETGMFPASQEFLENNHFLQLMKDQKEFIDATIAKQDKRPKRVVLFGVSEGGNIAAAIAAYTPEITHLMVLGSGGMKGIDEFRIWGKQNGVDFDKLHQEVKQHPDSISRTSLGHTYKYWASVLSVEPMKYYQKISIPVLAAIGGADEMVPVETVEFMRDEFNRLGKKNLTVKIYADSNHALVDASGQSHRKTFLEAATVWWSK